jgi:predicted acyltransferase
MTTLQGWLDRAAFGDHIWVKGKYDPEGLLSTLSAVATALFGVLCGRVLAAGGAPRDKAGDLLRLGAWWLLAGAVWSWFLPINKPLWTPSYALWTGGIAAAGLGLCVWAFEQRGWQRWARPLQVYGLNALLVFVGSALLARVLSVWKVDLGGKQVDAKTWFFRECLLAPIGDPHLASLAFGVVWVLGWYAVLAWLYRRNIVWRV